MKLVLPFAIALLAFGAGALAQVGGPPGVGGTGGMPPTSHGSAAGGLGEPFQQREQTEAQTLRHVVLNVCSEELKTYCAGKTGDAAFRCLDYHQLRLKGACKTLHAQAQVAEWGG
ncbi:hypothetical protein [Phenylobacterium sp.]|uniref:hypothetical protein n=1 Tax=Phenylobacterium sp. TaxID=1871053 RepID=UPI0012262972|nr:hypothetical protein [Phenylobacterium sp.]THD61038.1 MAG: hypothetical protein E8A49_12285 [Phenylobacterium sp.]